MGGDIAAHDAGADDMHMAKIGGRLPSQALEPILQQEHADQVARCGSAHELADRSCLGLVALGTGGAVPLPKVQDGVGRRILLAPHALSQCRGGLSGDERARRAQIQELIHEGCRCRRRRSEQPRLRALSKVGRRHEFVDQTHRERARPLVRFALEHEIEGRAHTDELHAAHRAAKSWMDAEQYFG
jgi:hypothetical protein